MSTADRAIEQARKAAHLVMRTLAIAPEHRRARDLARQAALRIPEPAADARRVLMVSARDWAAHVQYEAVIGHALRLRGADVRFLTCGGGLEICDRANTYEAPPMPCTSCSRYTETSIQAHGFGVRRLADLWPADASWPDLDHRSQQELGAVVDDGLPLGRLVDVPLKWFLCSASIDDDPLAATTQRAMLRSARQIARAVERSLDEWTPDVVVMVSGLFLFEAVIWACCARRGIDVVTYERAFRKETLVFSRDVPAGYYDFGRAVAAAARPLGDAEAADLDRYLAQRRRGEAFDQHWSFTDDLEDDTTAADGGRTAVAFTNLTWDSAVVGRDAAFPGIREWIDCLVEEFAARPQDRLVIRVHPSEVRLPMKRSRDGLHHYLASHHADLPPNVTVIAPDDPTSSYPLMDAADLGLVYTSTTGLELALMGTPVIVAGEVHYRGQGFTNDANGAEAFRSMLRAGLDDPAVLVRDPERARRYAHFFWFRAPLPAPGVSEPVPGLARVEMEHLCEVAPGVHPRFDQVCAAILDPAEPFVAPEQRVSAG